MPFDPVITDDEVKAIADLVSAPLTPFINVASQLIDDNLIGQGLSGGTLRNIGIYLSAHFAFMFEGQVKAEKIGDSSTTFNMATGQGLSSTTYGQMAIMLDTSKTLVGMNDTSKKAEAEITFF